MVDVSCLLRDMRCVLCVDLLVLCGCRLLLFDVCRVFAVDCFVLFDVWSR